MISAKRPISTALRLTSILIVIGILLLNGCKSGSKENLSKLVWITYVHVANIRQIQAPSPNGSMLLFPTQDNGFWAVFDICTLDVQGSAITGFNYAAINFYVDAGSAQYGTMNPGLVGVSGANAFNSYDPQIQSAVHDALNLSPATQYFPKQLYPSLNYRIAIFVNENPPNYRGEPLDLKYLNHPVTMQNKSPGNPQFISFYNAGVSPQIHGNCP